MLLWDFLRFVEAFQPKFFVMENVRGLLSAAIQHRHLKDRPDKGGKPLESNEEPGSVVDLWLSDLAKIAGGAYRVDCFEVNAVNYGAPQLRERVLFFGNRLKHMVEFPAPSHGNVETKKKQQLTLFDEFGMQSFMTLGDALDTVENDDGEVMDFSPRKKQFLSMVPEGGNWRTLPVEVQKESMGKAWFAKGGRSGWWRRLSRDLPCPTVVTMPNHSGTAMCHPTETRALTVRECAAIQEFPNNWMFSGTTAEKYTQIGNALPVRLARTVGDVIAEHCDQIDSPRFVQPYAPPYRRIYLKSHVRTRQWYKDGVVYTWADGEDNTHAEYSAKRRATPTVARRTRRGNTSRETEPAVQRDEVRSVSL
jgi:DNA (cytosine-5)-methyltransferase 1